MIIAWAEQNRSCSKIIELSWAELSENFVSRAEQIKSLSKITELSKVVLYNFRKTTNVHCLDSSVGRASDWRSEGPVFDPQSRQIFFSFLRNNFSIFFEEIWMPLLAAWSDDSWWTRSPERRSRQVIAFYIQQLCSNGDVQDLQALVQLPQVQLYQLFWLLLPRRDAIQSSRIRVRPGRACPELRR